MLKHILCAEKIKTKTTKKANLNPRVFSSDQDIAPRAAPAWGGSGQGWSRGEDGAERCPVSPTSSHQPCARVSSRAHPGDEAGAGAAPPWDPAFGRETEGGGDAVPGAAAWAGGSSRCCTHPAGQCQEGRAVGWPWPCQRPTAAVCSRPPAKTRQGQLLRLLHFARVGTSPSGLPHPPQTQQLRAAAGTAPATDFAGKGAREPQRGWEKSPHLLSSLSLHGARLMRSATDTSLYKYTLSPAPAARAPKANPISAVPLGAAVSPPSCGDGGSGGSRTGHQPAGVNRGGGIGFGSKIQNFPQLPVSKVQPATRHGPGGERARPRLLSGWEPRALGAAPASGGPLDGWRGAARHHGGTASWQHGGTASWQHGII